MTERQAWDMGRGHAERLRAEAEIERQVRAVPRDPARIGGARRSTAALARGLSRGLGRLADALDGRRRTIST